MILQDVPPIPSLTEDKSRARKIAWRVAAVMLLAIALLNAFTLITMPDLVTNQTSAVLVINVVLAIGLLCEKRWALVWTLGRAVLGGIVLVIAAIVQQNYLEIPFQIALAVSLGIVLTGRPHKRRTLVAGVLFAITFFIMADLYVLAWLAQLLDIPIG
ncbi:MAG: hypothetical protein NT169_06120 [Chloroflexi bacterium]|nr:hypothetical protein [Chloroflexota bacterium]